MAPLGSNTQNKWTSRKIVFTTGFVLNICSFILLFISFSTPAWFVSWPRVHSGFKKIGLWEACFAGLVLDRDPTQKAYHGCWWILAPEYYDIREWLMPWWFVITQLVVTLVLLAELVNLIIMIILLNRSGADEKGMVRRAPMKLVTPTVLITVISAIAKTFITILFGAAVYLDRNWMPRPDLNYLSWSYGLFIVGTFCSIFSSISHLVYLSLTREEYRRPPPQVQPLMRDTTF